jgi:hypothetical protein
LVRKVSVQNVHWKVFRGAVREVFSSVGLVDAFLLLLLRPRIWSELIDPKEPREAWENAEAKELALDCDVLALLADEPAHSERPDPSSVKLRL